MVMSRSISTVVFDVNETLSDLAPLSQRFAEVGAAPEAAKLWFATVLRDGLALAATGSTAEFSAIGRTVMAPLLSEASLDRPVDDAIDHVMQGFMSLEVHPDVPAGVTSLHEAGLRLITLSNGSTGVAEALLTGAGLRDRFETLLSVQEAGIWKPARTAYDYAAQRCGTDLSQMLLVAVHPWDLHGGNAAGMQTAWINRSGADYPDHFSHPDLEVTGLDELAGALAG